MPVARFEKSPDRIAGRFDVALAWDVAKRDSVKVVGRKTLDSFARQWRPVVDEMDLVSARPFARQVRHHQFGATHSVSNSMFHVETDLHIYVRFTSDGAFSYFTNRSSSDWVNNYLGRPAVQPTSYQMQRPVRVNVEKTVKKGRDKRARRMHKGRAGENLVVSGAS
jgi:hypothetical protein